MTNNRLGHIRRMRAARLIAAALLMTALTLNVQAAGRMIADTMDELAYRGHRATIQATHTLRLGDLNARLALGVDGVLTHRVKTGVANLSYTLRLGACDAAYTLRTGARDALRAIEDAIRQLRL